jgi:hypothetical protein
MYPRATGVRSARRGRGNEEEDGREREGDLGHEQSVALTLSERTAEM